MSGLIERKATLLFLGIGFVLWWAPVFSWGGEEEDQAFYVKKDTWQETLLVSRARFLEWSGRLEVELGPWYATAPLKAENFSKVHFPGAKVDLDARNHQGDPLWLKREEWTDGKVHSLPSVDHASSYLFRTIHAKGPLKLAASLGSDDGLEVWLNGTQVISKDVPRAVSADQDRAALDLKAGENRFLFKVHNISGAHGFYFSLKTDPLIRVWQQAEADFPLESGWMKSDLPRGRHLDWFRDKDRAGTSQEMISGLLKNLDVKEGEFKKKFEELCQADAPPNNRQWLDLYLNLCQVREAITDLDQVNLAALRRVMDDLMASYPERYGPDKDFSKMLLYFEQAVPKLRENLLLGDRARITTAMKVIKTLEAFQRDVLLSNPLLDFDTILLVRRKADTPSLGLPQNWQGNCSLPRNRYDDTIDRLAPVKGQGALTTFFRPEKPSQVADVDLHFDADRMLFSMLGSHDRWQIFEIKADGTGLRQVTPGIHPDVDNYDACYLPDGRIIFDSTRCFQGIPCVGGADQVANLCIMDDNGENIRQLCFDQDHNWCPTMLNNGRVLYSRWEYSDTPHYFTRLLFHMNPDGTAQMEYYGSNSFWPNSIFYARPIPGHPTQVAAIVSGHHGVPRMGELILFDPARGRFEADGVIQRIPGFGKKVEPIIRDTLVDDSWPRFLHPFPLSDKYFIVSCQPAPGALWGVYLVDVFDNMLCLSEEPGYALLEPIPFKPQPKPPVVPDRVQLDKQEAVVYLEDVYLGEGLAGVPRGTVKRLRVYDFHYCYNQMGGHIHVGIEGPWDVHRIRGTVPVYEDGSASFVVPANTPIAVQPLDKEGKALQVMRSWFTAMPGEVLSCVGCHERQNTGPEVKPTLAARRPPVQVEPWYGPARGFSFKREVQPVLNQYCVGCHGGEPRPDGMVIPDFSEKPENGWSNFTPAYIAIHPFVRRPGPESDYHLQKPLEYHVDTSELVQMLAKGHQGVKLDKEAWDRLITWIDLNVPDHGTWGEHKEVPSNYKERRLEMLCSHANRPDDQESIPEIAREQVPFVEPEPVLIPEARDIDCPGWPMERDLAQELQRAGEMSAEIALDLGDGVEMDFVLIPSGEFLMGDDTGYPDEWPRSRVAVAEPFYMGRFEVTCDQYNRFDPDHFNGYHDQRHKDHTTPGYPAHGPNRPVIRISWKEATAFCEWLSEKTGKKCALPTEAQWEWACRAGTDTPLNYGCTDSDFSSHANLADLSIKLLAVTGINPQPIPNPSQYQDYLPKDGRFDDKARLMCDVGDYQPNPFGLYDMHGNVCEWTSTEYKPYPYQEGDGRNSLLGKGKRVVRGGSWRDRPKRARSAFRLAYRPYQSVFNVGFRVVIEAEGKKIVKR